MSDDPLLRGLETTLAQLERLVSLGKTEYDANEVLRWAIQRLWIFAGNYAYAYVDRHSLPKSTWPWSDLIGFRGLIAHWLPEQVEDNRIWHETVRGLPEVIGAIRGPGN